MVWKVILSENMAQQVQTKPPEIGFFTKKAAELWAIQTYGSAQYSWHGSGVRDGYKIEEE